MDNRSYRRLIALHLVAGLPLAGVLNMGQPESPPPNVDGLAVARTWADRVGVPLPPDVSNVKAALNFIGEYVADGVRKYDTSYIAGDESVDIAADDPRVTGAPTTSPPPATAPDSSTGAPAAPTSPAGVAVTSPPPSVAAPVEVPAPSQPAPPPVSVSQPAINPESAAGANKLATLNSEAQRLRAVLRLGPEVMPDHFKGLLVRGLVDAYGAEDIGAMLGILAVTA